jgi:hypothetical protein
LKTEGEWKYDIFIKNVNSEGFTFDSYNGQKKRAKKKTNDLRTTEYKAYDWATGNQLNRM